MPDQNGRFRGIAVPRIPWHPQEDEDVGRCSYCRGHHPSGCGPFVGCLLAEAEPPAGDDGS